MRRNSNFKKEKLMFKNRHFQVKLVKDAATPVEDTKPLVDPEELSRIAKEVVKYTAIAGVVVMGAAAVFNTLSEIAVIVTEANVNKDND
jgi:hypothetical protein